MSGGLTAASWSRIHFLDGPICDGCGAPFEYDLGARRGACLGKPRAFDAARAACLYDEVSRDPILKLKHADRLDLAPLFARWLSRCARELIEAAPAIAPVPLHPGRLLRRRDRAAAGPAQRRPLPARRAHSPPGYGDAGRQVRLRPPPQCGGRIRCPSRACSPGGRQTNPADR